MQLRETEGAHLFNWYNESSPLLSLLNPATTAFRYVPRTKTDCLDSYDCVTGFGFCPITNGYKIVRTFSPIDNYKIVTFHDSVDHGSVNRVEVFSSSRGSWKEIDDIGNLKGVRLYSGTVTVNGVIFWFGVKLGEDEAGVIVSFDIAKEVFTLMPRPDLGSNEREKLTVYENKLAILCDIWDVNDESADLIDLWVMEEDTCAIGEGRSWNKIYTSSPCSDTLDSMTIWRNEIVCKAYSYYSYGEDDEKRSVLYLMNVTTNEVKRFVIPYCGPIHSIYDYVEILVSVGNNCIEKS